MRKCRYPIFCGDKVIQEEAYCFLAGSTCQKWFQRHFQSSNHEPKLIQVEAIDHNLHVSPLSLIESRKENNLTGQYVFENNTLNYYALPTITTVADSNLKNPFNNVSKQWNEDETTGPNKQSAESNNGIINEKAEGSALKLRLENEPKGNKTKIISQNENFRKYTRFRNYTKYTFLRRTEQKECGMNGYNNNSMNLRILGGIESSPGKWPWQVGILSKYKEIFCGGVLISPEWILTAAHCLRNKIYVRLAEHDIVVEEGNEIDFTVEKRVVHPLYDATTVDNDIALLRLPRRVNEGKLVSSVCLPNQGAPIKFGRQCIIIGWGKTKHNNFVGTDVLNEARVPIIPDRLCRKVYKDYYVTRNMFCAGFQEGRIDSCAGDSGGPVLCQEKGRWYVHGITSFGEGCGQKGKFGIYAKVANYVNWIRDVIMANSHKKESTEKIIQ